MQYSELGRTGCMQASTSASQVLLSAFVQRENLRAVEPLLP
jgi:hypothetical protein